jgi:RimJ/RimL family protein N-acetyltransferase
MSFDIQIKSDRLIIRPVRLLDSAEIFRYRSNSVVNQFQGWIPLDIRDVQDFILTKVSSEINIPDTWVQLVIITKDTKELIGDIGIHFLKSTPSIVEAGITLDEFHHGKGYATEALKETIHFIFHDLNKEMILAEIDPQNRKSILLFSRLGFFEIESDVKDLILRPDYPDDLVYSLSRADWETRNQFLL